MDDYETPTDDSNEEQPKDDKGLWLHWMRELKANADADQRKKWIEVGDEVVKNYLDESEITEVVGGRFNIYWSSCQVMQPALYARTPIPVCARRFQDKDPIGKGASELMERSLKFMLELQPFDVTMKACRDDYMHRGLGIARVFYEPKFGEPVTNRMPVQQNPETGEMMDSNGQPIDPSTVQMGPMGPYTEVTEDSLESESVYMRYVNPKNFRWGCADTWEETPWVSFDENMTRKQLRERFGKELADKIDLDWCPSWMTEDDKKNKGSEYDEHKRATVTEIWDKDTKTVIWVCSGYQEGPLDVQEDPLKLRGFFPCPRPMFATKANDKQYPVPDYKMSQDQIVTIDELSGRIWSIKDMIKACGTYDGSKPELKGLVEAKDGKFVPIKDWMAYAQTGGLAGSIEFLPIEVYAKVLEILYRARELEKQIYYEKTGNSDLMRGSTNPNETATAQQLKSNFGNQRMSDKQAEIQRFARDSIALQGEIIAEQFSDKTLLMMSGIGISAPPDPQAMQKSMMEINLLRDDFTRNFRIEIETDSTIAQNEDIERQNAIEFLQTMGQFISGAVQAMQQMPAFAVPLTEAIMFVARRFRTGKSLEESFDQAMVQVQQQSQMVIQQQMQAMQQPQQEQQDPKMMEAQARIGVMQKELELKGQVAKAEFDMKMHFGNLEIMREREKEHYRAILEQQRQEGASKERQIEAFAKHQEALRELDLKRERMFEEMKLKLTEIAIKGEEKKAAESAKNTPKVTDVEFYDDPTTGVRRAKAVSSSLSM